LKHVIACPKSIADTSKVRTEDSRDFHILCFYISIISSYRHHHNNRGTDALKFLQGLVTNDVNSLSPTIRSQYAAFLNNKGRVVSDVILSMNESDDYLIDCHSDHSKVLNRQLKMYKLRSDVDILDLSETHDVLWSGCDDDTNDDIKRKALIVYDDPRASDLGTRIVVPKTMSSDYEDAADYESLRFRLGLAEGPEMSNSVPLEFNLDYLNGVSFRKGCYVGQELTARTHFRGVVRKRCMPCTIRNVESAENISVELPRVVKDEVTQKSVGKLLSVITSSKRSSSSSEEDFILGLALIRQEQFENRTEDSKWILDGGSSVEVVPQRPMWWVLDSTSTGE